MTYRKRRLDLTAHLRDMRELEAVMQEQDCNGAQLARASGVSSSYISLMRQGQTGAISEHMAIAIEKALDQKRGTLFTYGANGSEP